MKKIIVPRIDFNGKDVEVFIGINISINKQGEVIFKGGFVKEKKGITKTRKKKIEKNKQNKEQGESLRSEKAGDIVI